MGPRTLLYLVLVTFSVLLVSNARFLTGDKAAVSEPAGQQSAPAGTASPASRTEPGTLYRWRDADGHIHFSTLPPPESVQATRIPFVRTLADPPPAEAQTDSSEAPPPPVTALLPDPLTIYTPEGMADLFETIGRTARELETRDRQLDEMQRMLRAPN